MAEAKRKAANAAHVIDYFHQADDPYSHLALQALPALTQRYDIELRPHLTNPPPDWAAPERQQLIDWSRLDGARLAARAGLAFSPEWGQPAPDRVREAERSLQSAIDRGTFVEEAPAISIALWAGDPVPASATDVSSDAVDDAKATGDALRDKEGHYLGATFYYAGEWYWGIDRLHYLEDRLADLDARHADAPQAGLYTPREPDLAAATPRSSKPELHYYLSFRSPYTYIVAERVKALADAYGADLKLRFVLPMVMRSLPVPRMKGVYIIKDTAREARRVNVPFGKIADPVGEPVERGYAILPHAVDQGRGYNFAISFLKGVFSEGIDAGSDSGLRNLVERAGLDWAACKALIGGDHWQPIAEANRKEMTDLGIWGVPSFRIGDVISWGQDRLWVMEDALRAQD